MDEYISREAVNDLIEDIRNNHFILMSDRVTLVLLKSKVAEIPTADVQPMVRCKDCKHRKERHYEESGEKPYIKYECKFTKYSMSDDGFCSFGARMDGEQDD